MQPPSRGWLGLIPVSPMTGFWGLKRWPLTLWGQDVFVDLIAFFRLNFQQIGNSFFEFQRFHSRILFRQKAGC
jgi:hypothetical protein